MVTPDDGTTKAEKGCGLCGKPIPPARSYCSTVCYHTASRKHADKLCEWCGKVFRTPPCHQATNRRFCCRDCYLRFGAARLIEKVCPVCDRHFTVPQSISNRYTVCSLACRWADSTYTDCPRCGKRMSSKSGVRVYCSETCRRPPVHIDCANCGKTLRVGPQSPRRFCDRRCYLSHTGATRPEIAVAAALDSLGIDYTAQHKVGRRNIDFAIGNIALEVDGVYWHNESKDARRDAELAEKGWTVLRITDTEIGATDDLRSLIAERIALA